MEARTQPKRWTYEEFARLPTSGSTRYEIIAGELFVTPGPVVWHQRVVGGLFARLLAYGKANGLGEAFIGPLDVLFAEGDCVEPDLLFVRGDRSHLVSERGVEGPPDLVVEVLSPSTKGRDRGIKRERYRFFGVPEYWVVDPDERSVEVWRLADGASEPLRLTASAVLVWKPVAEAPSLEIVLEELFRGV